VRKNAAHSLPPTNGSSRPLTWRTVDQVIPEPLVISFADPVCLEDARDC